MEISCKSFIIIPPTLVSSGRKLSLLCILVLVFDRLFKMVSNSLGAWGLGSW